MLVRNRYKQGIKQCGMGTLCTVESDGSQAGGSMMKVFILKYYNFFEFTRIHLKLLW